MHRRRTAKSELCDKDQEVVNKFPEKHFVRAPAVKYDRSDEIIEKERRLNAWERIWNRLAIVKYLFLVLIIPPILNYAALQRERSVLPAQGELVDMGWGQQMFIKCFGEGLPTVILDAPTGGTSDLWHLVQSKLSKTTKVCVYDRAGLGFSQLPFMNKMNQKEKGENRKFVSQVSTLEQMTCDLHHLISVAKPLKRPLVLVGSEIGGLIARHYALTHPEDVYEIVLLNPLVEDLFWHQKEEWNAFWNFQMLPSIESLQLSAFIGISRLAVLAGHMKADISGEAIPKEVEITQLSHLCNGHHIGAVLHEYRLLNTSFSQMNEIWRAKEFPKNISVTVINSQKYDKFPVSLSKAWQESQLYLRQSLHPSCKHYIADGPGQQLFIQPKTVVNIVQQIVHQWRVTYDVLPTIHTFWEQEALAE